MKLSKKAAKAKLKELEFYLGMVRYRKASMNPGPGIEQDEDKLVQQIKEFKKQYDL